MATNREKWFECRLPKKAPQYVHVRKKNEITELLLKIHKRMETLQKAYELSSMRGENFQITAKKLWEMGCFDRMSAEDIAEFCIRFEMDADYERIEWPNAISLVDTMFLTTPEWEAIRCCGIGGSDAAVVLGVSPYRGKRAVYHDKVLTPLYEKDNGAKQYIFSYGHSVEQLVIDTFCERTGAEQIPETRMFASTENSFITANIDAIVKMPDGRLAVFEAKTTSPYNQDMWENGGIPVQYVPQIRQYMNVLDDPRINEAYIGCIFGNTPDQYRCSHLLRDIDKEKSQVEQIKEFWEYYVLENDEPELSGNVEHDKEIVEAAIDSTNLNDNPVELPVDLKEQVERYLQLDDQRKGFDKQAKSCKEAQELIQLKIIELLGSSTKGIMKYDDLTSIDVSYKPVCREVVDKDMLKLAYPEIAQKVISINSDSRRFSLKAKRVKVK
ncbi:MAG: YqaJ viral recombinase family protein [Clostridiales bacterium]|nr:YqaJ viral recombinase family protein [Clostridiales bacterium]